MNVACQRLIQHLDQRQINYAVCSDNQSIASYIFGSIGDYRLLVQAPDESDLLQLFGFAPIRVPIGARPDIAEVLARINHQLRVGKFTLDFESGDLAFHMGQLLGEDGINADAVDWMICTTLAVMDKFLPAMLSVIYSNERPEEAVRRVSANSPCEESVE
jgi:hypothetical protein